MEHTIVIETLKRLYEKREIDISKIKSLVNDKVISVDEGNYILGRKEK